MRSMSDMPLTIDFCKVNLLTPATMDPVSVIRSENTYKSKLLPHKECEYYPPPPKSINQEEMCYALRGSVFKSFELSMCEAPFSSNF